MEVERLRAENSALTTELEVYQEGYRERLSEWNIERLRLQAQMNELRSKTPSEDLEVVRDRYLASLKLGSSAPQYKAAKKALDYLINQLAH
jgi:hypothetical protein